MDYVEAVLSVVERIPPGRVMSYGAIADYVGSGAVADYVGSGAVADYVGSGGPRQVGAVLARHGGGVPWHRVVNAAGRVVPGHEAEALRRLRAEGTPLRGDKVDMRKASWYPDELPF